MNRVKFKSARMQLAWEEKWPSVWTKSLARKLPLLLGDRVIVKDNVVTGGTEYVLDDGTKLVITPRGKLLELNGKIVKG